MRVGAEHAAGTGAGGTRWQLWPYGVSTAPARVSGAVGDGPAEVGRRHLVGFRQGRPWTFWICVIFVGLAIIFSRRFVAEIRGRRPLITSTSTVRKPAAGREHRGFQLSIIVDDHKKRLDQLWPRTGMLSRLAERRCDGRSARHARPARVSRARLAVTKGAFPDKEGGKDAGTG
jgi:hypothetical protein